MSPLVGGAHCTEACVKNWTRYLKPGFINDLKKKKTREALGLVLKHFKMSIINLLPLN